MPFFKDDPTLQTASLKPAKPFAEPLPAANSVLGRMARTYNAVGGLIDVLAEKNALDPVAVLSVWYVESGGKPFTPGKPIIRFENHKFFQSWGQHNAAEFDRHFRFGSRAGVPGAKDKNHQFRKATEQNWGGFHGDQDKEYNVFAFACDLGSKEAAAWSVSFGGPQIMGFNHAACGYQTATELSERFSQDERWHVLGFFDFVKSKNLVDEIRNKQWVAFGAGYNGDGATYGPLLERAFDNKPALARLPRVAALDRGFSIESSRSFAGSGQDGIDLDGFVLRLRRFKTEERRGKGFARTVSRYEAFFNREKLAGFEGVAYERQGPGDNSATGTKFHRRIAAGKYPLFTQGGTHYVTIGYTTSGNDPKPGVLVGDTGRRVAILVHPGNGYLSSVGCINLSKELPDAGGDMAFTESQGRVISFINSMEDKIGTSFPARNGKPIPGGWLVVEGEPMGDADEGEAVARSIVADHAAGGQSRGIQPGQPGAGRTPRELYDMAAATMNGQALPEYVSLSLFEMLQQQNPDLKSLRGEFGRNLWFEWGSGWQASIDLPDQEERERVQADLGEIAQRLKKAGVNINDTAGLHTPLIDCARANEWAAVRKLHEFGADLDLRDRSGNTALAVAAFHGARQTVEYLVKAGANRRLKTAAPEPGASRSLVPDGEPPTAEEIPVGSSAQEAAARGRSLAEGNPALQAEYDAVAAALTKAPWWRLFGR